MSHQAPSLHEISADPRGLPSELQGRLKHNPAHEKRRRYLAYSGGPVGFMSVDLAPDFVLYELYVIRQYRQYGVGTFMLERLVEIARAEGRAAIFVRPHPLDASVDRDRLRNFYIRHGFVPSARMSDALELRLI
jgi:GNAT superfamily N-acetyltransferase